MNKQTLICLAALLVTVSVSARIRYGDFQKAGGNPPNAATIEQFRNSQGLFAHNVSKIPQIHSALVDGISSNSVEFEALNNLNFPIGMLSNKSCTSFPVCVS